MTVWSADFARAARVTGRLGALAVSVLPLAAGAQEHLPVGDWQALGSTEGIESQLQASVDAVAADLSIVVRPVARELLRRAAQPCSRLRVWTEDEAVAIQCDQQAAAVAVPNGEPVAYTGHDGRTHTLIVEREPDGIVQRFITPRGSRTSRFVLDGDTLRVDVALDSPRLSEPLRYTIAYR